MAPCTEMGRKPTKQLRDYPKEEGVSECEVVCVILKVVPFPPQGGAFLNWFLPSDFIGITELAYCMGSQEVLVVKLPQPSLNIAKKTPEEQYHPIFPNIEAYQVTPKSAFPDYLSSKLFMPP
ncbi:hypothetical protein MG293_014530 [Ovis ammon polii]|uniref:Uncharacterized protein n=1 Tax=Ovis ammon polii TaxID=230172 RepID=A0AAD4TZK0_OVIAM|nr:hypothetical protein MG293_014530 [Ovis ammon polii]